jgi:hypothetical protein
MNLTRDSMLALQRHFLGALSTPARTWLEPLPSPPLAFAGEALRWDREGCVLDLGDVRSPGEERHRVRVCNRGAKHIDVRVAEVPAWLTARWLESGGDAISLASEAAGATLEVVVAHDEEREFRGTIAFVAEGVREVLSVRLTTRRPYPYARIDFNGSATPRPFDFGSDERPYELSVANMTAVPLVVTFADLPAWLAFEIDGHRRSGPIAGTFFERKAPFVVKLLPQSLGPQSGALRLRTNDARPEIQDVELQFSACLLAAKPRLHVAAPHRMHVRPDQKLTVEAQLENWGRAEARTSKEAVPRSLAIRTCPVVPAARDGKPGTATLPIRIAPAHLAPGAHALVLSLRIEGGEPAIVDVPVQIDVTPRRKPTLRAETIAALFALLLVALLFVIARGLS